MAEISIDELRRLARNFLIGKGGEAELEDTKRAMESDPQLAMEFLQQMQAALDDVAPAGFSQAQWTEIDVRVKALIAPLAKSGFGLGFIGRLFSKLFGKKSAPAEGPARIKRKGGPPEKEAKPAGAGPTSLLTAEAVVAPESSQGAEGMEEMAPIAPAAAAPAPEAAHEPQPEPEPAAAAPASGGKAKDALKKTGAALLVLLLLAGLGWGGWKGFLAFQAWQARKKAAALPPPTPVPTPAPTPYDGPPRRSRPPAWQEEPLPSELPPMTPQPAGRTGRVDGLEAKEEEGKRSLPLP